MDLGLSGKRALVLGASQGLGKAVALGLAAEGAMVTAAARRPDAIAAWATETVTPRALDLADRASVAALAEHISATGYDIIVNNSGGPAPGSARAQSDQTWLSAFETMATSLFSLTQAALSAMERNGFGRIVTIGSSGVEQPIPGLALSNGVRLAIVGWSKTLAAEVAPVGITVNMVIPGRIATDRVASLDRARADKTGQSVEEVEMASRAEIPLGRYGTPEEFAAAVAFLCSRQASYITGTILRVDGGLIKSL